MSLAPQAILVGPEPRLCLWWARSVLPQGVVPGVIQRYVGVLPSHVLCRPCSSLEPSAEVIELARAGKEIDAMRVYRRESGADLRQAKKVVDEARSSSAVRGAH